MALGWESRPLTWGVEFELIVMSLPPKSEELDANNLATRIRHPERGVAEGCLKGTKRWNILNVQEQIAETLRQNGIKAITNMDRTCDMRDRNLTVSENAWLVHTDATISMNHTEETLRQMAEDGASWYGIELISPPMYYSEDAINYLRKVCYIMSSNYRTIVNQTCGFHVHIGDGVSGFSVDILKKLMGFLWTFETKLAKLHPEYRRENLQCPSLCHITHENRSHPWVKHVQTRRDGLERIFQMTTVNQMVGLLTDSFYRSAYDIRNLEIEEFFQCCRTNRTIEFRIHEGVDLSDSEEIIHWLRVCHGLVIFAQKEPLEDMKEYLQVMVEWADIDEAIQASEDADVMAGGLNGEVIHILMKLGLKPEALYYAKRFNMRLQGKSGLAENGASSPGNVLDESKIFARLDMDLKNAGDKEETMTSKYVE